MTKKLYPHFNPKVHKIESKIATVRTSHHCKCNINYHVIRIPKYRKPILQGKVIEVLKNIITWAMPRASKAIHPRADGKISF